MHALVVSEEDRSGQTHSLILHNSAPPVLRNLPIVLALLPRSTSLIRKTRVLKLVLDLGVELGDNLLFGFDDELSTIQTRLQHLGHESIDLAGLCFNHEDDRIVAQICVGSVQHAEVGEGLDSDAVQGFATSLPDLADGAPTLADDVDGVHKLD